VSHRTVIYSFGADPALLAYDLELTLNSITSSNPAALWSFEPACAPPS
jgi:hypothetical protein